MRSSDGPPALVVLTGAGISRESGLSTFRDADGAWRQVRLEDVATPQGFRRDPARVHGFYNARRAQLAEVAPNAAHHALGGLERAWQARGGEFLLVTQNVDDLHERAGSRRLVHMHGSLNQARCERECGREPVFDRAIYKSLDEVGHAQRLSVPGAPQRVFRS